MSMEIFNSFLYVYQRVFGNNLQTLSRLAEASREQVRTLEDCAGHSWPCGCGGGGQGLGDVRQWHLFRLPTGCCDWARPGTGVGVTVPFLDYFWYIGHHQK